MPAAKSKSLATPPKPNRLVRFTSSVAERCQQWLRVVPLPPPKIEAKLLKLPALERAAEVVRYSVLRAEFWLSPGGTLRAVWRLSLKLALLLSLPALVVGPAVVILLHSLAVSMAELANIAANLAALSFWLIAAAIGFAVLTACGRNSFRR